MVTVFLENHDDVNIKLEAMFLKLEHNLLSMSYFNLNCNNSWILNKEWNGMEWMEWNE